MDICIRQVLYYSLLLGALSSPANDALANTTSELIEQAAYQTRSLGNIDKSNAILKSIISNPSLSNSVILEAKINLADNHLKQGVILDAYNILVAIAELQPTDNQWKIRAQKKLYENFVNLNEIRPLPNIKPKHLGIQNHTNYFSQYILRFKSQNNNGSVLSKYITPQGGFGHQKLEINWPTDLKSASITGTLFPIEWLDFLISSLPLNPQYNKHVILTLSGGGKVAAHLKASTPLPNDASSLPSHKELTKKSTLLLHMDFLWPQKTTPSQTWLDKNLQPLLSNENNLQVLELNPIKLGKQNSYTDPKGITLKTPDNIYLLDANGATTSDINAHIIPTGKYSYFGSLISHHQPEVQWSHETLMNSYKSNLEWAENYFHAFTTHKETLTSKKINGHNVISYLSDAQRGDRIFIEYRIILGKTPNLYQFIFQSKDQVNNKETEELINHWNLIASGLSFQN